MSDSQTDNQTADPPQIASMQSLLPPPTNATSAVAGNPNSPASYQTSPSVNAVAPIIAQITGGNKGNTLAGVQAAQGSDNNFFGDIAKSIQDTATKVSAAFSAGKQVGAGTATSSAPALAGQAVAQGVIQGQAQLDSGMAAAKVAAEDAMHAANRDAAIKADAVRMGLDPNNPDTIQAQQNMRDASARVNQHLSSLSKMEDVGFFDNPGAYLLNHLINIPVEKSRAQAQLGVVKDTASELDAQSTALQARGVIDTALNSKNTTSRAANLYSELANKALAEGVEPMNKAIQTEMSAWNLGVNQSQLGIQQQKLQIEKAQEGRAEQMFPGQLLGQQIENRLKGATADFYGIYKDSQIAQAKATADERTQVALKTAATNTRDAENLSTVNSLYKYFGATSSITDLNQIPKQNIPAVMTMASNLQTFGSLAQTPADAIKLVHNSGFSLNNIPDSQLPLLHHLDQAYLVAQNSVIKGQATSGKLSPADIDARASSLMNNSIYQEQNMMSSTNKVFQLPNINTAVHSSWAENNPVIQAMRPLAVDGNAQPIGRSMDGSALINTAANLIKTGKLTEGQAVDALRSYAHNTLDDIQSVGGFKRFGIRVEDKFPIAYSLAGGDPSSSAKVVNLRDPADILKNLRLQAGAIKGLEAMEKINSTSPGFMGNFRGPGNR